MILQYASDGGGTENECLAAAGFLRAGSFRTNSDQRQTVIAFRKANPCRLSELCIFKGGEFDNQQLARNFSELVHRTQRFVQMMNDIEQANIVELLIERLAQNITLKKFNPAAGYVLEQRRLTKPFSVELNADDPARSSGLGFETEV